MEVRTRHETALATACNADENSLRIVLLDTRAHRHLITSRKGPQSFNGAQNFRARSSPTDVSHLNTLALGKYLHLILQPAQYRRVPRSAQHVRMWLLAGAASFWEPAPKVPDKSNSWGAATLD
jgi:hypothetical protein